MELLDEVRRRIGDIARRGELVELIAGREERRGDVVDVAGVMKGLVVDVDESPWEVKSSRCEEGKEKLRPEGRREKRLARAGRCRGFRLRRCESEGEL